MSKNRAIKLKRITDINRIYELSLMERAIVYKTAWGVERRMPAAFVINYQAHLLIKQVNLGLYYERIET